MLRRTKYIAPSRAEKAFQSYSSALERFKEGNVIYRGLPQYKKTYAMVKPSKTERSSKNTSNVYTALIDILPSWKEWPKRSRSVVCSSGKDYALGYAGSSSHRYGKVGSLYSVLPKNGAKIGICSQDDFWNSFTEIFSRWHIDTMDKFNRRFAEIFYSFFKNANGWNSRSRNDIESMNGEEIQQMLHDADLEIPNVEGAIERSFLELEEKAYEYKNIIPDIKFYKFENDITWNDYFSNLMDPIKNGFELQSIENYNPKIGDNEWGFHEVWTDSDCLFVRMSYFNKKGDRIGNDFRYLNSFVEKITGENPNIT